MFNPNQVFYVIPSLPRLRYKERGGRKIIRVIGVDDYKETVFWTQQESWKYDIAALETACISTAHTQARQNSSREKGGGYEVLFMAKKQLAVASCWELISLLKCVSLKLDYPPVKVIHLRVYGHHKLYLMVKKRKRYQPGMMAHTDLGTQETEAGRIL